MSNYNLVNVLNLSITFITFAFTLVFFTMFVVYREKIKDKWTLGAILFVHLTLFIYSILTFIGFYDAGFFESHLHEIISFEHDFLAILTIFPMIFVLVKRWKFIPLYASLTYILLNLSNAFFLIGKNYLISIIHVLFIMLFGSYVGIYAVLGKRYRTRRIKNK